MPYYTVEKSVRFLYTVEAKDEDEASDKADAKVREEVADGTLDPTLMSVNTESVKRLARTPEYEDVVR